MRVERGPSISVIIPNHDGAVYLEACLRALLAQTRPAAEIVVVDNGSSDTSCDVIERCAPGATIIRFPANLGFAAAANAGVRQARSEWVAVLNNDTEPAPDWLEECAKTARQHPEAAFFACRIHDFKRRDVLYSAGDCFLRAGIGYRLGQEQVIRPDHLKECEIFSPCGCAALYSKSVFESLGGFDERFFAYLEDVDLGLRLQGAGYRGYYTPSAVVYHIGGGTSGGEFSDLAVRLRTRNSLFLLLRSLPRSLFVRWLPRILLSQAFWFGRVLLHGRMPSYLRGLAGLVGAPGRTGPVSARMPGKTPRRAATLRRAVLRSEAQARGDVALAGTSLSSTFLKWYFRLF